MDAELLLTAVTTVLHWQAAIGAQTHLKVGHARNPPNSWHMNAALSSEIETISTPTVNLEFANLMCKTAAN